MADWQPVSVSALGPALLAEGGAWGWVALPVLLLAGLLALCRLRPAGPLRLFLWLLTHSFYRLRVLGRENVPARGGALLVCNRVSYLDWLLLLAAHRRFIRCVVFAGCPRRWWLTRLLRWAGAITIDGSAGPRAVVGALRQAADAVARGELVCVFAEGRQTQTGLVLPFQRGFERIVKHCRAPVIPVCLDQPWGSLFSLSGGRVFWKWPQRLPCPVGVGFGPPLPPGARAAEVRQAVQRLSADCAIARPERRPVHRRFVRVAARHPFRTCLIDSSRKGQDLTYGKTLAGAMCLARVLRPVLGDEPLVGVWLPSSAAGALVNIALALLGKTAVNLNYTSSPDVIGSCLAQCGSRHVITARRFTARMPLDPDTGVELIHLEDLQPAIGRWQRLGAFLAVVLLPGLVLERWVLGLGRHGLDELATVIFSSGSTGEPKGVMLTHGNVAANLESVIEAAGVERRDRVLGVLPLFHSFGYTITLWAPLQVGASVVYHADPRQAKEIGELCRAHRCSIYVSTATFLRYCLKKCDPGDFRSLRILVCGAEKLPPPLAQEFAQKFGVLPLEGYGCTELSPAAAINTPDEDLDGIRYLTNRTGTIGQPLPGIAARVVHPETLEPLPAGEEGLLLVYGPNVMKGYLGKPDLTAQVVRDGWYVTGDMGSLDADGFITLTGRLARFAKIGGEMVPLEKIEEELHDVLQTSERVCAVTCVPDEARGERLVVLHLPHDGLEVRPWVQQLNRRGLPNLWLPSERDFFPVPELPVLGSGKVNLQRLKEMALELARK